jgi:hypothetical protein
VIGEPLQNINPQDVSSMKVFGSFFSEKKATTEADAPSTAPTVQVLLSSPTRPASPDDASDSGVEIVLLDGIRVFINKDFDRTVLKRVLHALKDH